MDLTPEEKAAKEQEKADKAAAKQAEKEQKELAKQQEEAAKKQEQSEQGTTAVETQEIKFLRTHPNYAYWPGDTAALTAEHVEFLTEGGFAEVVTTPE